MEKKLEQKMNDLDFQLTISFVLTLLLIVAGFAITISLISEKTKEIKLDIQKECEVK